MGARVKPTGPSLSFVGRECELRELKQLLDEGHRLITVVAPGGYGKTRVVEQLCAISADEHAHGLCEVLLAPVGDEARIASATADALGLRLHGDAEPEEQLLDYLREKELLLHFDNFEHLLEGGPLLSRLLEASPGLRVLVTSREPLQLPSESVYNLASLPVGDPAEAALNGHYPAAAQLFADRAAAARPDFVLTSDTATAVAEICGELGGVPLAIELAAAWVDQFSLPELKKELREQIDITTRESDVPKRHRSLRASCDWSHSLLNSEQQLVLRCISVFRGGFFLDAGTRIIPVKDLPRQLQTLVDKSWLYVREVNGERRYFIHDAAIREYAFQKLLGSDDYDVAVVAHCEYYAELTARESTRLQTTEQLNAVRGLSLELENLYQALDTAVHGREERLLLQFADHLHEYLLMVGGARDCLTRYREIAERAAALRSAELAQHANLGMARSLLQLGRYAESRESALAAQMIAGDRDDNRGVALASTTLGEIEKFEGNHVGARFHYNHGLQLMREVADPHGVSETLHGLGRVEVIESDYATARSMIKESLALRREVGDLHGIASCLNDLGNMEYREGDYPAARALHAESLEIRRQLGDLRGIAQSLNSLGNVEFSECDYPTAWSLYSESLAIRRDIGERFGIAASLNNLGNVEYCEGHYADARELHAEGLRIKREIGDRIGVSYSLNNLGNITVKLGEYDAARQQLVEALAIARELGSKECMLPPLAIGTCLFALAGQHRAGAILRFGARKQIEETGLTLDPMDGGTLEEGWFILRKELPSGEIEEFSQAAGRMSLDELVEFALKEFGDLKIPDAMQ